MAVAPTRICELVETFDRHIEAYRSSQYNETQLRREFIDPFFEELGWDVTNKAGCNCCGIDGSRLSLTFTDNPLKGLQTTATRLFYDLT